MTPLRLAVVTGNIDTVVDGIALTLRRQIAYLQSCGDAVRVYAPGHGRRAGVVRVPAVPVFGTPYLLGLGLPPAVRHDLRQFDPTAVLLTTPDLLGVAGLRWAVRRRVPAVATYFTFFSRYLKHYGLGLAEPLAWRLNRWFYQQCAEVHVPAPSLAAELRAHGVTANFVDVPFGFDGANFSPALRSPGWRHAHGAGGGVPVVLFVGRLVWEKGLRTFAAVIQRLETQASRTSVWSSATARPGRPCGTPCRGRGLPGCSPAAISARRSPRRTCSCSRASPRRSAW